MCVIAYKAKDVRFPSEKNVRDMWTGNPDGAGVMWRTESGTIRFSKGFMKLKHLEKWIADNRSWLDGVECALHFRITTHGGTCPGNCHPFVAEHGSDPHLLSGEATRVLMHNGVLPLKPRDAGISDSAELALRMGAFGNASEVMKSLDECLYGNRIILMDEDGTHFFGDAFKPSDDPENAGILYSNLNFEGYGKIGFFGGWHGYSSSSRPSGGVLSAYTIDERSGLWKECLTGKLVQPEEVDPFSLDGEQYDYWCDQMEFYDECYGDDEAMAQYYGMTVAEYRDVKAEAESFGMDIDEYLDKYVPTQEDARCLA